jgi:hypothetical protein
MPRKAQGFFGKYGWEIAVALAIIFFIILFLFNKRISKWLDGRTDFTLPGRMRDPVVTIGGLGGIGGRIPSGPPGPPRGPFGKYEERCREIMQAIFQRPFVKARPDFLKRGNGRNLELDGWNKDLKLAFEYQGVQHYKFWPRFHRSMKDFEDQLQRDREKRELCLRAGVRVVEIPYNIKYDKLEQYIREQLRNMGVR